MAAIYRSLIKQTASNINELTMVITSGQLRMSDDQRLSAIDRIYDDTGKKLAFLRNFNRQAKQLAASRNQARQNAAELKKNYGIQ